MEKIWKPHATVAGILEQDGKFLLVEEETTDGLQLNQPAGHWEAGETLPAGVIREVLEESAYHFEPEYVTGIYRWHSVTSDTTYLRFAFSGKILGFDPQRPLDEGILRAIWMTPDEILRTQARHRSPLVLRCVEDYLAGNRFPLSLITHYD